MLVGDSAELRKARGAFYTPPRLARYVADWAVRSADDAVLEPSCGEAAFLIAAGDRLSQLRAITGPLLATGRLAASFLKAGGRLGLVLPAELLSVNYASEVRGFLMRRFGRVRLVLFEERVFPGVLEEVVLLLAEGDGPTDHCELYQVRDLNALEQHAGVSAKWKPRPAEA